VSFGDCITPGGSIFFSSYVSTSPPILGQPIVPVQFSDQPAAPFSYTPPSVSLGKDSSFPRRSGETDNHLLPLSFDHRLFRSVGLFSLPPFSRGTSGRNHSQYVRRDKTGRLSAGGSSHTRPHSFQKFCSPPPSCLQSELPPGHHHVHKELNTFGVANPDGGLVVPRSRQYDVFSHSPYFDGAACFHLFAPPSPYSNAVVNARSCSLPLIKPHHSCDLRMFSHKTPVGHPLSRYL